MTDLRRDEGVRDKPYKDSRGFLTIGVGHNLDAEGLCQEAIDAQLIYDINKKLRELDQKIPWWRDHPEDVQRVIVNLAFNLGVPGLLKWPLFLLQIKTKLYKKAASNIRANRIYVSQVGQRAERLALLLEKV